MVVVMGLNTVLGVALDGIPTAHELGGREVGITLVGKSRPAGVRLLPKGRAGIEVVMVAPVHRGGRYWLALRRWWRVGSLMRLVMILLCVAIPGGGGG